MDEFEEVERDQGTEGFASQMKDFFIGCVLICVMGCPWKNQHF